MILGIFTRRGPK